jgi:hypothetical protein
MTNGPLGRLDVEDRGSLLIARLDVDRKNNLPIRDRV